MYLKIIAIVMDNASNNNTMMTSLERRCRQQGIQFSAEDARMRCMPHTIHLAALKASFLLVLEGIGVSLVNRRIIEVVYLSTENLRLDYSASSAAQLSNYVRHSTKLTLCSPAAGRNRSNPNG